MDAHSPIFYERFPLYARLADQSGTLLHLCNAIQPELDEFRRQINLIRYLFDPSTAPSYMLDWLGQWVGLAPVNGRYLGLGINPSWSPEQKRRLIKSAWNYWQMKGTEVGIREAISLWLDFPEVETSAYALRYPFGKTSVASPPGWWGWGMPYGSENLKSFEQVPRLGGHAYIGRPQHAEIRNQRWQWAWGVPWDGGLAKQFKPDERVGHGHMGPRNPWQHFHLTEDQWHKVFPGICDLNPEIWDAHISPLPMGWLESPGKLGEPSGKIEYPLHPEEDEIQVEVLTSYSISGFGWCDVPYGSGWPWPAGSSGRTEYEAETVGYGVWPGARFNQPWGLPWYAEWREWTTGRQAGIQENCDLGKKVTIKVGTESAVIPGTPPTPTNQLAQQIDGFTAISFTLDWEPIELPSIDYLNPVEALPLVPERLEPIPLGDLASFDILFEKPGYRWRRPIRIAMWNGGFGRPWYHPGSTGTPDRVEERDVFDEVWLCNNKLTWDPPEIKKTVERRVITRDLDLGQIYPVVLSAGNANSWQLLLESDSSLYVLKPHIVFWKNQDGDASSSISLDGGFNTLALEFLVDLQESRSFRSAILSLNGDLIHYRDFYRPLTADSRAVYGFKYDVTFVEADRVDFFSVEDVRAWMIEIIPVTGLTAVTIESLVQAVTGLQATQSEIVPILPFTSFVIREILPVVGIVQRLEEILVNPVSDVQIIFEQLLAVPIGHMSVSVLELLPVTGVSIQLKELFSVREIQIRLLEFFVEAVTDIQAGQAEVVPVTKISATHAEVVPISGISISLREETGRVGAVMQDLFGVGAGETAFQIATERALYTGQDAWMELPAEAAHFLPIWVGAGAVEATVFTSYPVSWIANGLVSSGSTLSTTMPEGGIIIAMSQDLMNLAFKFELHLDSDLDLDAHQISRFPDGMDIVITVGG